MRMPMNIRSKIAFSLYLLISIFIIFYALQYISFTVSEPMKIINRQVSNQFGFAVLATSLYSLCILFFSFLKGNNWSRYVLTLVGSFAPVMLIVSSCSLGIMTKIPGDTIFYGAIPVIGLVLAFFLSVGHGTK